MESTSATRRALLIIIAAYVALALCYSFVDPLKMGSDEPAHFIYVRAMATGFAPPAISHDKTPNEFSAASHEGHQPPLYYAAMAVPYALLDALGVSSDLIWRILRLLTIPIGVAWVWAVWRLAREFFGRDGYALAATGLAALIPTAALMGGVVNNEILIALLFTWSLVYLLAYFKSGVISARSCLALGLLMGLATLTKGQGLILPFVFLVVSLLVCRRAGYANWREVLKSAGTVLGLAVLVSGWWYVRNVVVHGTLTPQSLHDPRMDDMLASLIADPWIFVRMIWFVIARAWGYLVTPFWLLNPNVSWEVYLRSLFAVGMILLVGFVLRLRRNGGIDRRSLALLIFTAGVQLVLYVHHVLSVDFGAKDQGRLFLTVGGVAGICGVLAIDGFARTDLGRRIAAVVAAGLVLALNGAVIWSATRI